ncbi:MAG: hypothetical protein II969_08930 [Anaerolineaceae bacterium]|nr:hypothetical protein [Anaerolineaceae bacterium]
MIIKTHNNKRKYIFLWLLLTTLVICGCTGKTTQSPSQENKASFNNSGLKVGDSFTFGSYEQDNDLNNGTEPIEWQVLAIENNRALLISRYALDAKQYNKTYINVTWFRSTLRKWLNEEFYHSAFSPEEKTGIMEVKNSNPSNSCSRARGGFSTKDRIFLLSIDEADKYFTNDTARQCEATAYAKANGAYVAENGNSWWWLRSPGRIGQTAAMVLNDGYITYPGYGVVDTVDVVRPAFWLDLQHSSLS